MRGFEEFYGCFLVVWRFGGGFWVFMAVLRFCRGSELFYGGFEVFRGGFEVFYDGFEVLYCFFAGFTT